LALVEKVEATPDLLYSGLAEKIIYVPEKLFLCFQMPDYSPPEMFFCSSDVEIDARANFSSWEFARFDPAWFFYMRDQNITPGIFLF
jgi:hypothetical protein